MKKKYIKKKLISKSLKKNQLHIRHRCKCRYYETLKICRLMTSLMSTHVYYIHRLFANMDSGQAVLTIILAGVMGLITESLTNKDLRHKGCA